MVQDVLKTQDHAQSLWQVILQSLWKIDHTFKCFTSKQIEKFEWLFNIMSGRWSVGKLSFDFPNQPKFFAFNDLTSVGQNCNVTIISSSGKDSVMHAWAFFCLSNFSPCYYTTIIQLPRPWGALEWSWLEV